MVAYSFKKQFVVPICLGLGIPYEVDDVVDIDAKPKRQTIRAIGKRRHARPSERIQLYTAMRTKQCRKIADVRCAAIERIIIWPTTMAIMLEGKILTAGQIRRLSSQDGFKGIAEMKKFWLREHGNEKFEGVLIRWEPLTN